MNDYTIKGPGGTDCCLGQHSHLSSLVLDDVKYLGLHDSPFDFLSFVNILSFSSISFFTSLAFCQFLLSMLWLNSPHTDVDSLGSTPCASIIQTHETFLFILSSALILDFLTLGSLMTGAFSCEIASFASYRTLLFPLLVSLNVTVLAFGYILIDRSK